MECHTLMFEKKGQTVLQWDNSDLTSFWWILMVATCEHNLKLKDLNAKLFVLLLGPFWPATGDIC